MAANAVVVTVVAVILGIVAVTLSFVAYANRIKVEDVGMTPSGVCTFPSSPAFGLGIVAALFLLIEQIVISVGTGCFCCRGTPCPSSCGGISSLILFIISWLAFIIAFMGLIFTAIVNNSNFLANSHRETNNLGVNYCYVGKETLFLGAAIWSIVSVVLGVTAHHILNATSSNGNRQRDSNFANEHGVAMGQPQALLKGQY